MNRLEFLTMHEAKRTLETHLADHLEEFEEIGADFYQIEPSEINIFLLSFLLCLFMEGKIMLKREDVPENTQMLNKLLPAFLAKKFSGEKQVTTRKPYIKTIVLGAFSIDICIYGKKWMVRVEFNNWTK